MMLTRSPDGFETGRTLFVGDSDIDYWPTSTGSTAFAGSYNVGVAGYTCEDVLGEIDTHLAQFQPATVVLVCGENDMSPPGESPTTTFNRFKQVHSRTRARGTDINNKHVLQESIGRLYLPIE
eukprot:1185841-Prorocentrum_minimum.AAC.1